VNAVFEGGGIKGLAYVGALRYLEERGIRIAQAAGTSVGAIMASLVVVGYNSYEIESIINNIDVNLLWPKKRRNKLVNTYDTIKKMYVYPIEPLEDFLNKLYETKGKRKFKDIKIGNNYKLKVIVTYFKNKQMLVFPDDLPKLGINPDEVDIAKVVCMSSSLPFVYPPYKLSGHSFLDGGLSDNFPIWIFSDNVIGFRINKDNKTLKFVQKKVFKNKRAHESDNVICIDTCGYKATNFVKGIKERNILYNRGYYFTKQFFTKLFMSRS
jgi:NTE family protein